MIGKLKIATFGCSFACLNSNLGAPMYNNTGRPWMKILSENFKHDVTSYGLSGSSVYYSYLTFKENYKKYDKIIFLGTYADRKYCPVLQRPHITSAHINEDLLVPEYNNLIKTYFTYFHNIKEADDMKELMVEDIKKLGGTTTLYIDTPTTLGKVSMMEEISYVKKPQMPDHRWCHMSNENNFIFASQINDWLNGIPFTFDLDKFKKPTIEELKSYYEP